MTYFGNEEILKNHKIAFFCSQKCPAEVILKSFNWAIEQRNKGNCIIIGAHSQVEKDVFHSLLKGEQPFFVLPFSLKFIRQRFQLLIRKKRTILTNIRRPDIAPPAFAESALHLHFKRCDDIFRIKS